MSWSWDIGLRGMTKLAALIVSWMGRCQAACHLDWTEDDARS